MGILYHPIFALAVLLALVVEMGVSRLQRRDNYLPWETFSSAVIIGVDRAFSLLGIGEGGSLGGWLYDHRIADLSMGRNLALTFLAAELGSYWAHRWNHRTNIGWATHQMHHTPTRYNLMLGWRLGLTRAFSLAWLVFIPLVPLGFHPNDLALCVGLIFIYQFFIHTELVPRLGFLDTFLNTPANHRVHHAADRRYYDKNYGGVTILFDRLFGTYAALPPEGDCGKFEYGFPEVMGRRSVLHEVFHHWARIGRAMRADPNPLRWLGMLFGTPDGFMRRWGKVSQEPRAAGDGQGMSIAGEGKA